jgi:hypothetical protein
MNWLQSAEGKKAENSYSFAELGGNTDGNYSAHGRQNKENAGRGRSQFKSP